MTVMFHVCQLFVMYMIDECDHVLKLMVTRSIPFYSTLQVLMVNSMHFTYL